MAKKTSKQLLKSARQLLKRNWTEGSWIVFEDGEGWDPGCSWDKLTDKLREKPNPDCRVCAEGAVYLACALAGEDQLTAKHLVNRLNERSKDIYGSDIISINDADAELSEEFGQPYGLGSVLTVFEELEKTEGDSTYV